ncbi:ATP-binding protein, partial [Delftia tsuruhatensis]
HEEWIAFRVYAIVRDATTNEGQTIDPSHLPRLFDRFYRADSSRTQARSNHGLGLAIVAAIARLHQGNVFARSEAGVTSIGLIFPQISDDA